MKEGWEYKKLGVVTKQIRGVSYKPTDLSSNLIDKYVTLLRANNIQDTITFDDVQYVDRRKVNDKQYLKSGDILICASSGSKNLVGKAAQCKAALDACFGAFCKVVRPININNQYVGHFFQSNIYKKQIFEKARGANINNIKNEDLDNILIPVPPLPIQKQIVSHLDKLNEILDKLRDTLNVLDKAEQAIFYDMFGDPVENEKGWEIKKVKDIATVVGGSTPKTNVEEYWNGDLNWITPAELVGSMYLNDSVRKITNKAVHPVGTVILSSRAPIGKIAISNIPTYCNQGFKNIICSSYISNIYVYAYLKCRVDYLISLGRGATFKEISKTIVENIPIPLPPLSLQQTFAARITTIEAQKQKLTTSIAKFQEMLDGAMDNYFSD